MHGSPCIRDGGYVDNLHPLSMIRLTSCHIGARWKQGRTITGQGEDMVRSARTTCRFQEWCIDWELWRFHRVPLGMVSHVCLPPGMAPPGVVPRVWCPLAWCLVHGAPCMVPPVQVQGVQHGAPCAAWSRKWGMEGANLQNLGIAGRVHDGRCKCRQCRMVRNARGRAEEAVGCGGSQNGMAV